MPEMPLTGNLAQYATQRYRRVLELGPYDGAHTVVLSQHANHVFCIEARIANIQRLERRLVEHGLSNVVVLLGDIEHYDFHALGQFDCVWASGVIYHVRNPVWLIARITRATRLCFGWTHLAERQEGVLYSYGGRPYIEQDSDVAGLSPVSWWLTADAFIRVWSDLGWHCHFTEPPMPHVNGGLAAEFCATRNEDLAHASIAR